MLSRLAIRVCYTISLLSATHALGLSGNSPARQDPVVHLASGTSITGLVDPLFPSVRQFLGVPYARSPIALNRWRPPKPLTLHGNVSAKIIPRSCMQTPPPLNTILFTYDAPEFLVDGANYTKPNIGEDCLTLSVWAPTEPATSSKLPVIVFFHGGRFQTGGQAVPYQIPTQWVQRSKDLIIVTFNYRVNIWGFPNAAGIGEQNVGFLDQRLAVEWVHSNIGASGGDPGRITLWGQSAGAMAVDFYNYAYPSDPLATGLIMDSGSALTVALPEDSKHSDFTFIAQQVGCGNLTSAAELECMQKIPAVTIQETVGKYARSGVTFAPRVDEKIVFSNYQERAMVGNLTKLPAIMGTNKNEGAFMAPPSLSGPDAATLQQGTLGFLCPSLNTARNRIKSARKTYRYVYAGNFTNISPRPWEGAYHCSELPLIFGTHSNFRGNSTQAEHELSAVMQDTWLAFAKDPQQFEASRYGWPAYSVDKQAVRAFGTNNTLGGIQMGEGETLCASVAA